MMPTPHTRTTPAGGTPGPNKIQRGGGIDSTDTTAAADPWSERCLAVALTRSRAGDPHTVEDLRIGRPVPLVAFLNLWLRVVGEVE